MSLLPQSHPFIEHLRNCVLPSITEMENDSQRNLEEIRELSPQEAYTQKCFLLLASLLTVCSQLDHTVQLLSGYRASQTPDNYSRLDHIVYHLENHLIRVVMVPDRVLLLVNDVFRIGLPEKECKQSTVIDNLRVRNTPVRDYYRELEKYIQPYRTQRNIIVHGSKYTDPDIERLDLLYIIQNSNDEEPQNLRYYYLKRITDQVVRQKQQELTKVNKELFTLLDEVLSALQDSFIIEYENLDISGMIRKTIRKVAHEKLEALEKKQQST
jgi:hypothetical protein